MQLKLQLPGEKLMTPHAVWHQLAPDAQATFVRALAKAMVKEIEATQKEMGNGEGKNDGEYKDQAKALGADVSNICEAIDSTSG
jgi:hypothetical protein